MKTCHRLLTRAILTFALLILHASTGAVVNKLTEDFSTKRHCDTLNTTALWDTVAGELRLPPFELTLAGSYATAVATYGVAVSGDHAYVGAASTGLQVIDISDPTVPLLAGSYNTADIAVGVAISGDYAYVGDSDAGLKVIDISDPTAPSLAGSYNTPGFLQHVAVSGDYAYGGDLISGLQVIDISDPTAPHLAGSYDTPGLAYVVAIAGDYAYVADEGFGLQVVDISDPTAPFLAGSYDTPGLAYGVAISGDYAYVGDYDYGLQVIDISDPTAPSLAGSYNTPGDAFGVAITGDYVYVADGDAGLQVIDITDPTAPFSAKTYETLGTRRVAVSGHHAFVTQSGSLLVIDVSDPVPPTSIGSYDTPDAALRTVIAGDYAFVADRNNSFQVFDVSNPSLPVLAGSASVDANDVAIAGDYAYLPGDFSFDFIVVDISDPTTPAQVGSYHLSDPVRPWGVAVAGDYAYVPCHDGGFFVFDVSDPTTPSVAGSLATPSAALRIELAGDYAYVAEYTSGLHVIDISNPTAPSSAGGYNTPGDALGIALAGDHAFVADGAAGLQVIDITDPTIPVLVGSYDTPGEAQDVAVTGDYAFVADRLSGLQVIDISDPANPTLIGSYDTSQQALGVIQDGDYVYVSDDASGLQVIQVFQRSLSTISNVGQSLVLNSSTELVLGAKLTSVQTDSIGWEVSADSGSSWQEASPDGSWDVVMNPGTDLMWRSTSSLSDPRVNPTCTSVEVEWLGEYAQVVQISDIPNDQGRQARISWYRSGYDFSGSPTPITEYAIYRKIDYGLVPATMERDEELGSSSEPPAPAYPPGDWDFLISVPADCEDEYWAAVPTLADSTIAAGMYYTAFFVRAKTATPGTYFDSSPDSGYSVDNLAPYIPGQLGVAYNAGGGNQLMWEECPDADFQYYCVYRGESADFVPDTLNRVHMTLDTDWLDTVEDGWKYHYKVTAVDHSGNECDPTGPGTVTGSDAPEAPQSFALYQNVPNPFNPTTTIAFDVPKRASVKLEIYGVSGRLVRTLADHDMEPGRKIVSWDGRDSAGRNVASGIYFCRLETPTFTESKKMILLR